MHALCPAAKNPSLPPYRLTNELETNNNFEFPFHLENNVKYKKKFPHMKF